MISKENKEFRVSYFHLIVLESKVGPQFQILHSKGFTFKERNKYLVLIFMILYYCSFYNADYTSHHEAWQFQYENIKSTSYERRFMMQLFGILLETIKVINILIFCHS